LVKVAEPQTNQNGTGVITVCVDPASAETVRQVTLSEGGIFAGELHDYSLRQGELQPLLNLQQVAASVCVIDFDQDRECAVGAANTLQQMLHGKTTLIALSERSEPALILQAMRAGCAEYLNKPLSVEGLCESLTRLRGRLKSTEAVRKTAGKILAFLGCRGGAGTTTLAVHLAMFLSSLLGRKVLLVDQHRQLGHVGLYLGLDVTSYDFYELVRNVGRLDRILLGSFVTHHGSGLDVLPSPTVLDGVPSISLDGLKRAVEFLAEVYEYVILDSPHGIGDVNLVTVDCCDELYLIATPDVPALRDLSRFIERLLQCAVPAAKIRVVINRFSSQGAVSLKQIESAIRQPISITIPNHWAALVQAMNSGTPIAAGEKSEFALQMKKWAISLAPSAEIVEEHRKRRFSLWG
jgi:pilus assembly protein CpaE